MRVGFHSYHEPLAPPPPEKPPPNDPPEKPPPPLPRELSMLYSSMPPSPNTAAHNSHAQPLAPRRARETIVKISIATNPAINA